MIFLFFFTTDFCGSNTAYTQDCNSSIINQIMCPTLCFARAMDAIGEMDEIRVMDKIRVMDSLMVELPQSRTQPRISSEPEYL